LSFGRRVEEGADRGKLFLHILKRSVLIFAVGLFLNGFPYFPFHRMRIPGVLQRIAICYLIAGTIFLITRVRGQILWNAFFLLIYAVLMRGNYSFDTNYARYVDGLVLTGHMWSHTKVWDPEGIVSTLPAISSALFGILAGQIVRSKLEPAAKTAWLMISGSGLLWLGVVLNFWIPINKNLWTTSYSVFMAGLASVVFGILYWIVDVQGWKKWSRPFAIYGMNALTIFALAGITGRLLGLIKIGTRSLHSVIYQSVFAPLARPINASLLFAIAFVLLMYGAAYLMYRRGWIVRF
jgi:predicted acyltransferase